jgi:hypothetical protein
VVTRAWRGGVGVFELAELSSSDMKTGLLLDSYRDSIALMISGHPQQQ